VRTECILRTTSSTHSDKLHTRARTAQKRLISRTNFKKETMNFQPHSLIFLTNCSHFHKSIKIGTHVY